MKVITQFFKLLIELRKLKYTSINQLLWEIEDKKSPFKFDVGDYVKVENLDVHDFAEHPYTNDYFTISGEYYISSRFRMWDKNQFVSKYILQQTNEPFHSHQCYQNDLQNNKSKDDQHTPNSRNIR